MQKEGFSETACAILSLTTRIAWTPGLVQPMPRSVVRRMLHTGALSGLVLRDTPEIEEKWFERARTLLMRVSDVAERMEAYSCEGYKLLTAGDTQWPSALNALGAEGPLFLYIKGDTTLLERQRISVAGSRRILPKTLLAAQGTGRRIAEGGALLVTGGASGVDTWALHGALNAGGSLAVVPAMPVSRMMESKTIFSALERGKLLLVCDTLPDEPFSAAKALRRNHTIYALGDASLVVAAREGRGGSWRGATDCLRGGWSPVYVWEGDTLDTAGNRALEMLGAGTYSLESALGEQLLALPKQTSLFEGG